ncbi:MAG: type II toxin-antitoxin system VapB family antitoxin [Anaerolineae bacterium]
MAARVRKEIYIEPEQAARLKQLAAETGVPEAEIIREAIEHRLVEMEARERRVAAWEAAKEFIRQLMQQGPVEGGRTWRREDLYDRKVLRRR